MIAACVSFVRDQSCRLREKTGLDLTYLVDNRLRGSVERTVSSSCLVCSIFVDIVNITRHREFRVDWPLAYLWSGNPWYKVSHLGWPLDKESETVKEGPIKVRSSVRLTVQIVFFARVTEI